MVEMLREAGPEVGSLSSVSFKYDDRRGQGMHVNDMAKLNGLDPQKLGEPARPPVRFDYVSIDPPCSPLPPPPRLQLHLPRGLPRCIRQQPHLQYDRHRKVEQGDSG